MADEFVLLSLETLLALSKANLCPGDQDSSLKLPGGSSPSCQWDPVVLPCAFCKPCLGLRACVWEKGLGFQHRADILALTLLKGNTNMSANVAI